MPTRALMARLQSSNELPGWASYMRSIPKHITPKVETPASHCLQAGSRRHLAATGQVRTTKDSEARLAPTMFTSQVQGSIWELSRDAQGSRMVQAFLEEVNDDELEHHALELSGHVLEAATCPHANFVLQKCISRKAPGAIRAFAWELIQQPSAVISAAKHRYGCRILERLLEDCADAEFREIANIMLDDASALSTHCYGNYTIQHLLEYGTDDHRHRLTQLLRDEVSGIGPNFYAAGVLGQALKSASDRDAKDLAHAILREPGLIPQMARTKHGHEAARLAVQMLDPSRDHAAAHEM